MEVPQIKVGTSLDTMRISLTQQLPKSGQIRVKQNLPKWSLCTPKLKVHYDLEMQSPFSYVTNISHMKGEYRWP